MKGVQVLILSIFLGLSSAASLYASESPADSVVYAYLPYAKFDSDIGVEFGFLTNRYHYHEQVSPFNNLLEFRSRGTTMGLFSSRIAWETAEPFNTNIRSRFELIGERQLNDIYFSRGHDSPFIQEKWEDDYHFFDALGFELTYDGRYPLSENPDYNFDLLLLAGGITRQDFGDEENNLISEIRPYGNDGGWYIYAGTGLLFDSRNNEFDPRSGNYSRLELNGSPAGLISNHSMFRFLAETSHYYSPPFSDNLTLAGRLNTEFTSGDVPFWMLPEAGGEESVRGFPTGRFRDSGVIFTNLELRKWLLSFDFLQLRFGLTAFTDSGRVYSSLPGFDDLFSDYHRTWGGGPIASAFTRDFIIRAQLGRSQDMNRIYMNIGFTF